MYTISIFINALDHFICTCTILQPVNIWCPAVLSFILFQLIVCLCFKTEFVNFYWNFNGVLYFKSNVLVKGANLKSLLCFGDNIALKINNNLFWSEFFRKNS